MIIANQDPEPAAASNPAPRSRIGPITAGSFGAGLVAALLLVAAPFVEPRHNILAAAALLGFAFGWLLLAVLSVRFTDRPQRWAVVPAAYLALVGAVSLSDSDGLHTALRWVGPPVLFGLVIWTVVQARRRLPRTLRRRLLYPVLAVLTAAALGAGYQSVAEAADATGQVMPGQLIDVGGGRRLHLSCTGSGSPTVVLEPGLGATSAEMGWVASAVARDTRVCVYDRAGRGWSDPADGPLDGDQTAADLHTLLVRAQIPGPYVLAGHSFGGLYVLTFAARYPDEVAGLVLLDSTAPAAAPSAPPRGRGSDLSARFVALLPAVAHLGVPRLLGQFSESTLPPSAQAEQRAHGPTATSMRSFVDELAQGSVAVQQAAALVDFGAKPLVVVTAGRGHDAAWTAAQDALTRLSTNSRHRIVADATHASLLLNEADAHAASQAVLDVVASVRSAKPLA